MDQGRTWDEQRGNEEKRDPAGLREDSGQEAARLADKHVGLDDFLRSPWEFAAAKGKGKALWPALQVGYNPAPAAWWRTEERTALLTGNYAHTACPCQVPKPARHPPNQH